MAQRGVVTIPQTIRKRYKLKAGDVFTLIDIGGVFVLSPLRSRIDAFADEITEGLIAGGETMESMLETLREKRRKHGKRAAR